MNCIYIQLDNNYNNSARLVVIKKILALMNIYVRKFKLKFHRKSLRSMLYSQGRILKGTIAHPIAVSFLMKKNNNFSYFFPGGRFFFFLTDQCSPKWMDYILYCQFIVSRVFKRRVLLRPARLRVTLHCS